ncbi:hypothetical protein Lbys_0679 [Leadbetterella byssophila DSM 17132]|uniref:Fibronectin type-III domain-containing protein n=1 Tax=Leadbetterella byssophila (strain DSM 17132 / JCM 16389 / KACC 11308 / NBRC 106382 / 4M15) TaxID=649349 RepID=E4RZA2_LEAB4|nr:hypothetical protein [Leadbetterella byssophila]ADQ16441.1 hypothetical protein Lbys_0679 [Leadbetterella byssophila DSM 17132]
MKRGIFVTILLLILACEEVYPPAPPQFDEIKFSEIGPNSAKLSSALTRIGDMPITEHGFVVSEDSISTLTESSSKLGKVERSTPVPVSMTAVESGLKPNTTYYAKAYAIVNDSPIYGKATSFKTSNIIQPGIQTLDADNITHIAARIGGRISSKGTYDISEYGLVWATTANPTTSSTSKHSIKGNVTTFPTNYTHYLNNLTPNTTYHFRAYVISNGVTSYGQNLSFKTAAVVPPGISTVAASSVTATSAKLGGTLTSKGSYDISEYGIVWATSENPTTEVSTKYRVQGNVTAYPRAFDTTPTNLSPNTTYYFRAYVIANGVTTYGSNLSLKTSNIIQPGIKTEDADDIGTTTAALRGTLTSAGTYPITERGIVWHTSNNPTTANSKGSIAGNVSNFPSSYSIMANNLQMNTTYYYRAYVISNGVTSYGEVKTFKTENWILPTVSTGISRPAITSATVAGVIQSKGSHDIQEYGFVYATHSNPTAKDAKKITNGNPPSYPHNYTQSLDNLQPSTMYYFRAYALMSGTEVYGQIQSFKTNEATAPRVQTDDSKPSDTFATLFGTLLSAGSLPVSEYGFVYSIQREPTISNSKKIVGTSNPGSFPHRFNATIEGLQPDNAYHYRAYAIMNGIAYYGADQIAATTYSTPVLSTSSATDIQALRATLNGRITSPGSFPITEIGMVWNVTAKYPPTINDNKLTRSTSGVTYPLNVSITANGLPRITSVTYRIYVISRGQVFYGNSVSFTTTRL